MKFRKPKRSVKKVFLHCSAASRKNIDAEEIDLWHRQRGFNEIGYHFFIKTDGTLEEGRNIEKTPAAQRWHNRGSIAICLNGLKLSDFTKAQFKTLNKLCKEINIAYGGNITFWPHNAVAAKACPVYNVYDVLPVDEKTRKYIK